MVSGKPGAVHHASPGRRGRVAAIINASSSRPPSWDPFLCVELDFRFRTIKVLVVLPRHIAGDLAWIPGQARDDESFDAHALPEAMRHPWTLYRWIQNDCDQRRHLEHDPETGCRSSTKRSCEDRTIERDDERCSFHRALNEGAPGTPSLTRARPRPPETPARCRGGPAPACIWHRGRCRRRCRDRPCRSASHWRRSRPRAGRGPSRNSRAP